MKSVTMKTDRLDKGKNTKKKSISVKKKDKEKKSIFNSKYLIILIVIIVIIGLVFIIKHQKTAKEEIELADLKDDALSIGEQKYLEFLWLVDGAFNDAKYKETIAVNDITIQDENKKFSCIYDDGNTCEGKNFLDSFSSIFKSSITYQNVYGDGLALSWIKNVGDKYYFTNNNSGSCNISRMSTEQKLEVVEATNNEITYKVSYTENIDKGIYKGSHDFVKDFVLVKENDNWKVSKAYYHDPCYVDYNIESK